MKFSIIVPVYNSEKYLKLCIESILNQKNTDFELLLINDGSKDGSINIINEYVKNDKRVILINKENGGASSARNMGLDFAKGEMIVFIDSDDTVGPNYLNDLEFQYDEEFVQCGVKILENDYLKPIMTHDEIFLNYNRFWLESRQQWPSMCCLSKKIIDENHLRFNEDLIMGEDGLFNHIYISKCKKIRRTNKCEYFYNNENLNSVSHKFYPNRLEQQLLLIKELEHNFSDYDLYRIRWDYWHEVLNHYNVKGLHNDNRSTRKLSKKMIKKTYECIEFRKSIPYIKNTGSLDEKIEVRLMHYKTHWLYSPLMLVISFIYKLKTQIRK